MLDSLYQLKLLSWQGRLWLEAKMKNKLIVYIEIIMVFVITNLVCADTIKFNENLQIEIYAETAVLTNAVEFSGCGKVSNACWCYGRTTFEDIGLCLVIAYSKDNGNSWTMYAVAPQGYFNRITRWFKTLQAFQYLEEEARKKDWIRHQRLSLDNKL